MNIRARQFIEAAINRLFFVPLVFVLCAIVGSQLTTWADRHLADGALPPLLETTVESGRAILSTIAGGLISSVTLLLSLMLVAVQLASSQYSPRTLRTWLGNRTQQVTIGVVLGTSVYCLLVLRETRTFGDTGSEGDVTTLVPHMSVLLAVVLGVLSLVLVVRSVDHLTNSLRIGAVADAIMAETLSVVEKRASLATAELPAPTPANLPAKLIEFDLSIPDDAIAIGCPKAGWIQQIDENALLRAIPPQHTTWVSAAVGTYVLPHAPLAWTTADIDQCGKAISDCFAIGDTRSMQQDVGFGILRMVDIAVRALSPGINDPNTANDLIVHLGVVILRLWEAPRAAAIRDVDDRRLVRNELGHVDYLRAAFDPIRRYGYADPDVVETLVRTISTIRSETVRRDLPGPLQPLDDLLERIRESASTADLIDADHQRLRELTAPTPP